jgi:hypothetical protein
MTSSSIVSSRNKFDAGSRLPGFESHSGTPIGSGKIIGGSGKSVQVQQLEELRDLEAKVSASPELALYQGSRGGEMLSKVREARRFHITSRSKWVKAVKNPRVES